MKALHELIAVVIVGSIVLASCVSATGTTGATGEEPDGLISTAGDGAVVFHENFERRWFFPETVILNRNGRKNAFAQLLPDGDVFLLVAPYEEDAVEVLRWRLAARLYADRDDDHFRFILYRRDVQPVLIVEVSRNTVRTMRPGKVPIETSHSENTSNEEGVDLTITHVADRLTVTLNETTVFDETVPITQAGVPGISGTVGVDDIVLTVYPENASYPDGSDSPRTVQVQAFSESFSDPSTMNWWRTMGTAAHRDDGVGVSSDGHLRLNGVHAPTTIEGTDWELTAEYRGVSRDGPTPVLGLGTLDGEMWGYLLVAERWRSQLVHMRGFDAIIVSDHTTSLDSLVIGDRVTMTIRRTGNRFIWSIAGTPLFDVEVPADVPLQPVSGFFGGSESASIEEITLRQTKNTEQPPAVAPVVREERPEAPVATPGPIAEAEQLHRWHAFANRRSTARMTSGDDDGEIRLEVDMTANPDGGVHAGMNLHHLQDFSRVGGLSFEARATGVRRAHVTLFEESSTPDRVDSYFPLDEEWRRVSLPFNDQTFGLFSHTAGDGVFDYRMVGGINVEIYGYDGPGHVDIRKMELLPPDASLRIRDDLTVHDFDGETSSSAVRYTDLHADGMEAEMTFPEGGAGGSAGSTEIVLQGQRDGYAALRFGTGIGPSYDGFSVAMRSTEVRQYTLEFSELEADSVDAWQFDTTEPFSIDVPLNSEWVTWRVPFRSGVLQQYERGHLSNGVPDGSVIHQLGFLAPREGESVSGAVGIDELRAYRRPDVAAPVRSMTVVGRTPNRYAATIGDTLALNFDQHPGFDVQARPIHEDKTTESISAILTEAALEGQTFVMVYDVRDNGNVLELTIDVWNTLSETTVADMRTNLTPGLDIFEEIDRISEKTVRVLTDLARPVESFRETWDDVSQWYLYTENGVAGPVRGMERGLSVESPRERTLLVHNAYIDRPERIAMTVSGNGVVEVLAGFLGTNAHTAVILPIAEGYSDRAADEAGDMPQIRIGRFQRAVEVPVGEEGRGYIEFSREEDRYHITLNGIRVGTVPERILSFGRVGVAVRDGTVILEQLEVETERLW